MYAELFESCRNFSDFVSFESRHLHSSRGLASSTRLTGSLDCAVYFHWWSGPCNTQPRMRLCHRMNLYRLTLSCLKLIWQPPDHIYESKNWLRINGTHLSDLYTVNFNLNLFLFVTLGFGWSMKLSISINEFWVDSAFQTNLSWLFRSQHRHIRPFQLKKSNKLEFSVMLWINIILI